MKHQEIIIAKDFNEYPFGRFRTDGPASAEKLLEEILIPAIQNNDLVTIVLDGVFGYGSSFLEEAFGGLVTKGFSKEFLKSKLNFISEDDDHLIPRVWHYINQKEKSGW